ncbi:MAG: hypothetical protein FWE37_06010 [Spirochaetaceae bacterium]|nr:hypothetical protein [Spirochaetaceae bacterium]
MKKISLLLVIFIFFTGCWRGRLDIGTTVQLSHFPSSPTHITQVIVLENGHEVYNGPLAKTDTAATSTPTFMARENHLYTIIWVIPGATPQSITLKRQRNNWLINNTEVAIFSSPAIYIEVTSGNIIIDKPIRLSEVDFLGRFVIRQTANNLLGIWFFDNIPANEIERRVIIGNVKDL